VVKISSVAHKNLCTQKKREFYSYSILVLLFFVYVKKTVKTVKCLEYWQSQGTATNFICLQRERSKSKCKIGWLVGWMDGWLVGWLIVYLFGWLVGWLCSWMVLSQSRKVEKL
jgi:predicted O-linked N-acetylglucosamine transferase (SPINDLY family)